MIHKVKDNRWHFTIIPKTLTDDKNIDAYDLCTYNALAYYANNKNNQCFPSLATLAKKAKCSKTRLAKSLNNLEQCKYIDRQRRKSKGMNQSTIYTLNDKGCPSERHPPPQEPKDMNGYKSPNDRCLSQGQGVVRQTDKGCTSDGQELDLQELDPIINYKTVDSGDEPTRSLDITKNGKIYIYPDDFERAWKAYPRKRQKKSCWRKWAARRKEGYPANDLVRAAKNYAKECEESGTEQKFMKHGATFFGPDEHFREYSEGVPAEINEYDPSDGDLPII